MYGKGYNQGTKRMKWCYRAVRGRWRNSFLVRSWRARAAAVVRRWWPSPSPPRHGWAIAGRECLLSSRGRRNLPSESFVVSLLCVCRHLPCQFISNPSAQCCRPSVELGTSKSRPGEIICSGGEILKKPPQGRFFPHCLIHLYSKRISFHHELCTRSSFQYLHL